MQQNPQKLHNELMHSMIQKDAYREGEDIFLWQVKARKKLSELIGLSENRSPKTPVFDWVNESEDFTETRFTFESEQGYQVAAHLLMPKGIKTPLPLIICLQGHSTGMHISLGRTIYPNDAELIAGGRDFAIQVIKLGYAALTIEQRGFGECGGNEEGPQCYQPTMSALLMGRTMIGERVFDVQCAIDIVTKYFSEIDTDRIAIMGNSGGGTASIYAAALDTRISAVVISCALAGFRESIGTIYHCACNYVPHILKHFDMGDIGCMIAPRPLVVVNGLKDEIFPIDSAKEQFEKIQSGYIAANATKACRHIIGQGGHRFYPDKTWAAFADMTGWQKNKNG